MARVTPRPASRCPRCQFAFASADLMLDHLSAEHLRRTASDTRVVRRYDAGAYPRTPGRDAGAYLRPPIPDAAAHVPLTPEADAVLADLERTYRRSSSRRPYRPRRSVLVAILTLLLITWLVVILA